MFDEQGILISGPARSGLSEVAALIDGAGAFGGDVQHFISRYHATYLNNYILQQITKPLMLDLGVDPKGQEPLPDIEKCHERSAELGYKMAMKVEATLIEQGYKDGSWYYSDAKICLAWPIWHAAFPKAKIIFVRREPGAHLKTLRATGYMQHLDKTTSDWRVHKRTDEFWLKWIAEHEKRLDEMLKCETLDMRVVWSDKSVADDFSEVQSVIEWLGLEWDEKKARKLVKQVRKMN